MLEQLFYETSKGDNLSTLKQLESLNLIQYDANLVSRFDFEIANNQISALIKFFIEKGHSKSDATFLSSAVVSLSFVRQALNEIEQGLNAQKEIEQGIEFAVVDIEGDCLSAYSLINEILSGQMVDSTVPKILMIKLLSDDCLDKFRTLLSKVSLTIEELGDICQTILSSSLEVLRVKRLALSKAKE